MAELRMEEEMRVGMPCSYSSFVLSEAVLVLERSIEDEGRRRGRVRCLRGGGVELREGRGLGWEGEDLPYLEDSSDRFGGSKEAESQGALRSAQPAGEMNEVETESFQFGMAEQFIIGAGQTSECVGHVVGQESQFEPGRIGSEFLTGHMATGKVIFHGIMHMLNRAGLFPVPVQKSVAPVIQIGEDRMEMSVRAIGELRSLRLEQA